MGKIKSLTAKQGKHIKLKLDMGEPGMTVISALRGQENNKFEANMSYIMRPCLKTTRSFI
jgi:hypothetical protein